MSQVKDPVCGMMVDTATAAGSARFEGETYYFCSAACEREFGNNPRRYSDRGSLVRASGADQSGGASGDPPRTTSGGITAPKFGSAGSGGAEFEPGPESDRRS